MKELVELIAKLKQDGEYYEEKSFSSLGDTVPTPGTICYRLAANLESLLPALVQSHRAEMLAAEAAALRLAVEALHKHGHDRAMAIVEEHILPDQLSALDALVIEVLRQEYAWALNHSAKEIWERYQAMLRSSQPTPGATN